MQPPKQLLLLFCFCWLFRSSFRTCSANYTSQSRTAARDPQYPAQRSVIHVAKKQIGRTIVVLVAILLKRITKNNGKGMEFARDVGTHGTIIRIVALPCCVVK